MTSTRERLLDEAERLTQQQGFNAFSFRALAEKLQIKTPSVHHHFPSKADLARALVERYHDRFRATRAQLAGLPPRQRLEAYVQVFVDLAHDQRLCLCGSLAADLLTLSDDLQRALRAYFEDTEAWLEATLREGAALHELTLPSPPRHTAQQLLSLLEGAALTARTFHDPERLTHTQRWIFDHLLTP